MLALYNDSIASINPNDITTPDGQQVMHEKSEISASSEDGNMQDKSANETTVGTLEGFSAESGNEPIISSEEVSTN